MAMTPLVSAMLILSDFAASRIVQVESPRVSRKKLNASAAGIEAAGTFSRGDSAVRGFVLRAMFLLVLEQPRLDRIAQSYPHSRLRSLILRVVYFRAHGIAPHLSCVVGPENILNGVEVGHVGIEPHVVFIRGHNYGHPVVHVGHERIWPSRQDGAAFDDFALGTPPLIPQTGQRKHVSLANFKTVRLLDTAHCSPLVESVCGDEAAFGQDGISKCRQLRNRLRPSIQRSSADAHVLGPMRYQTPAHHREPANLLSLFTAHGENRLSRCDVVAGSFVEVIPRLKAFGQVALGVSQSVAVAHFQAVSIALQTFCSTCSKNCAVVFKRTLQVEQPGTTTPVPPFAILSAPSTNTSI